MQFANTGRNRIAGLEAEAGYNFSRAGYAYANFTWLEPKRLGSGGEITDIPKWRSPAGSTLTPTSSSPATTRDGREIFLEARYAF